METSLKKFDSVLKELQKLLFKIDNNELDPTMENYEIGFLMRLYNKPLMLTYIDLGNMIKESSEKSCFFSFEVLFRSLLEHHAQVMFINGKGSEFDFLKLQGWFYSNLLYEHQTTTRLLVHDKSYREHAELLKSMIDDELYMPVSKIVNSPSIYWYKFYSFSGKSEKVRGINDLLKEQLGNNYSLIYNDLSRSTHSVDQTHIRKNEKSYDYYLELCTSLFQEAIDYFLYKGMKS